MTSFGRGGGVGATVCVTIAMTSRLGLHEKA